MVNKFTRKISDMVDRTKPLVDKTNRMLEKTGIVENIESNEQATEKKWTQEEHESYDVQVGSEYYEDDTPEKNISDRDNYAGNQQVINPEFEQEKIDTIDEWGNTGGHSGRNINP